MLVLSRRLNEKIILPDLGVTLQVTAIDRGRIRIGIEAPPDIRVIREELVDDSRTCRPSHQLSVA